VSGPAAPHDYAAYHARRFACLLELVEQLAPPGAAILEVGVGPFLGRLRARHADVTSLGFPLGTETAMDGPHIPFDLEWTLQGRPIATGRRFDLVIFAEVVEHLNLPPEMPLAALRPVLKPDGRLIVQTPNAAALVKRLALVAGRHPYDPLRASRDDPGHIREYTRAELLAALGAAGFAVERHAYASHFARPPLTPTRPGRAVVRALQALVPAFRDGQTVVARLAGA